MPDQPGHPFEPFRAQFESLDWSRGLALNDLRSMLPGLPPGVFGSIPDHRRFSSFEEFWTATRNAPRGGAAGPVTGAVNVGGTHATYLDPEAPANSDL